MYSRGLELLLGPGWFTVEVSYLHRYDTWFGEAKSKKLDQTQRSHNSCWNKMTLGLPIGVPQNVYKCMYTLYGEDWQCGLCPFNLHTFQASTLGLEPPPKEFRI